MIGWVGTDSSCLRRITCSLVYVGKRYGCLPTLLGLTLGHKTWQLKFSHRHLNAIVATNQTFLKARLGI